jgi:DNA-binding GntR family transcriptional regulator
MPKPPIHSYSARQQTLMNNVFKITQQAAPVRKLVEKSLRNAIITGVFPPGAHLVDRELCDMFGVSRTVVREAQRSLEAEGLVVIAPHKGVFVRKIEYEEAVQIYDVRKVLEALAGQQCAMHATPEDIEGLKAIYDELKANAVALTNPNLIDIKTRFYVVLLRGAKHPVVEKMLSQLLNYNTQLRATSLAEPGRLGCIVQEIGRVVDAIARGDAAEAGKACYAHVENASQAAIRVLKDRDTCKPPHRDPLIFKE